MEDSSSAFSENELPSLYSSSSTGSAQESALRSSALHTSSDSFAWYTPYVALWRELLAPAPDRPAEAGPIVGIVTGNTEVPEYLCPKMKPRLDAFDTPFNESRPGKRSTHTFLHRVLHKAAEAEHRSLYCFSLACSISEMKTFHQQMKHFREAILKGHWVLVNNAHRSTKQCAALFDAMQLEPPAPEMARVVFSLLDPHPYFPPALLLRAELMVRLYPPLEYFGNALSWKCWKWCAVRITPSHFSGFSADHRRAFFLSQRRREAEEVTPLSAIKRVLEEVHVGGEEGDSDTWQGWQSDTHKPPSVQIISKKPCGVRFAPLVAEVEATERVFQVAHSFDHLKAQKTRQRHQRHRESGNDLPLEVTVVPPGSRGLNNCSSLFVISCASGATYVLDTKGRSKLRYSSQQLHSQPIWSLQWVEQTQQLLTSSEDGLSRTVTLHDSSSPSSEIDDEEGEEYHRSAMYITTNSAIDFRRALYCSRFHADSQSFVMGGNLNYLLVYREHTPLPSPSVSMSVVEPSPHTRSHSWTFGLEHKVSSHYIRLPPDTAIHTLEELPQQSLFVAGSGDGQMFLVHPELEAALPFQYYHRQKITALAVSDPYTWFTGSYDQTIYRWDARTPRAIRHTSMLGMYDEAPHLLRVYAQHFLSDPQNQRALQWDDEAEDELEEEEDGYWPLDSNERLFDAQDFDRDGFNRWGYDIDGYNVWGEQRRVLPFPPQRCWCSTPSRQSHFQDEAHRTLSRLEICADVSFSAVMNTVLNRKPKMYMASNGVTGLAVEELNILACVGSTLCWFDSRNMSCPVAAVPNAPQFTRGVAVSSADNLVVTASWDGQTRFFEFQ